MTQSSQVKNVGTTLQRYSNKRKMHCSICGDGAHRKSKCPNKEKKHQSRQGTQTVPGVTQEGPRGKDSQQPSKKALKEIKRQNMRMTKAEQNKGKNTEQAEQNASEGQAPIDKNTESAAKDKTPLPKST